MTATQARLDALDGPTVLVSHWPLISRAVGGAAAPGLRPLVRDHADGRLAPRATTVTAAVYGHLHIPRTTYHDGVRFEEVSVGYPREWRRRGSAPPPPRVILGGAGG